MGLNAYEIKFRKHSRGSIFKWHRYASNVKLARSGALPLLQREYPNMRIVSVRKLTSAQEKLMRKG